jgi:acyl-CoA hydrolase
MANSALTPRDSFTEMTELVLPQHANALGTAFGGTVMSWIDVCAAIVAQRHTGRISVTAAIDDLHFLAPIRVGDIVRLTGRINATFRTSLEIEVLVEIENAATRQRTLCADAKLTFVNVGPDGKPIAVPPVVLETEEDRERSAAAEKRRAARIAQKQKP